MAKKRVRKRAVRTQSSRRTSRRVSRSQTRGKRFVRSPKDKTRFIFKKLIFFLVLFLASFALYVSSTSDLFQKIFLMLTFLFGIVVLAFFISLLAFLFLKIFRK